MVDSSAPSGKVRQETSLYPEFWPNDSSRERQQEGKTGLWMRGGRSTCVPAAMSTSQICSTLEPAQGPVLTNAPGSVHLFCAHFWAICLPINSHKSQTRFHWENEVSSLYGSSEWSRGLTPSHCPGQPPHQLLEELLTSVSGCKGPHNYGV